MSRFWPRVSFCEAVPSFVASMLYIWCCDSNVLISVAEMEEFPGGVHYHRKNEEMKKIMSGKSNAMIFHMR